MKLIREHLDAIKTLCQSHRVSRLYAFGSVLTDDFSEHSDVDLIVDFEEMQVLDYSDNYFDLKFSLEKILERPIDLVEDKAIKNPYFRNAVDRTKRLIYG
ncbi:MULTISPECIES: nucleotidyltransferase family protein [unclassified Flavobacterium]|uniref:nucleotidyltransferase family protein n=1 Tax=unclassified Flavobacterium TaxID=196869 RepID=UPI001F13021D|nr:MULTISPECIES: nucleotidyltransferase domain-containing protein [unclassified Flavobacterium]UMY65452.1 nucleotidyltransferase domain-containing protein [Flavobacterium sp. HJ-32-4]HLN96578.1 nucleotidyltransferase domain-containing protein [Flavobacterium sp.]